MQTENRLLDDLARMANGALNTLSGVREEIESRVRERVERMLADMDMVPREEFEAVREMAQKARSEQEEIAAKAAPAPRPGSGPRTGHGRQKPSPEPVSPPSGTGAGATCCLAATTSFWQCRESQR
jgi:BMFP domain-containing protein YqiC